jgi:hypothetical protein
MVEPGGIEPSEVRVVTASYKNAGKMLSFTIMFVIRFLCRESNNELFPHH